MNVQELILHLQELVEQDESNAEKQVKLAMQPQWPFEYSINGVVQITVKDREENEKDMVYLEEGRQVGYLPSEAKEELGW